MCIYSAIYCAWAFSWRVPRASVAAARIRSLGARLGHDAVALAGMLWIALQIAFAWGVGASRVRDFHHHASDGGFCIAEAPAMHLKPGMPCSMPVHSHSASHRSLFSTHFSGGGCAAWDAVRRCVCAAGHWAAGAGAGA